MKKKAWVSLAFGVEYSEGKLQSGGAAALRQKQRQ